MDIVVAQLLVALPYRNLELTCLLDEDADGYSCRTSSFHSNSSYYYQAEWNLGLNANVLPNLTASLIRRLTDSPFMAW